jgi:hypothetical protein
MFGSTPISNLTQESLLADTKRVVLAMSGGLEVSNHTAIHRRCTSKEGLAFRQRLPSTTNRPSISFRHFNWPYFCVDFVRTARSKMYWPFGKVRLKVETFAIVELKLSTLSRNESCESNAI